MAEDFAVSDFALSTQKKFAAKLATNATIRNRLIDDETAALFKVIHNIFKLAYNNDKKKSEKLMRDVIKIVVKLGVLQRADRLDKSLLAGASKKIRMCVMTFISFHEVEFSFDKKLGVEKMQAMNSTIHELLTSGKVKEKTHNRLDNIASLLCNGDFLQEFYSSQDKYKATREELSELLNKALETGKI